VTDGSVEHDHALSKKTRENVIRSFASSLNAWRVRGWELSQQGDRQVQGKHTPHTVCSTTIGTRPFPAGSDQCEREKGTWGTLECRLRRGRRAKEAERLRARRERESI
jgi:hypothetical protein